MKNMTNNTMYIVQELPAFYGLLINLYSHSCE